ncbi:phosphatidylinositol transfer protein alpha isoform-like [Lucilia cuprina]|uniref:phosphatidylinositol transfer protein alpha isoform-like n=1 Tax=Lucilia cuprina TaxID=7375 RepID=UPI001F05BACF|nr:phosphatidylinositol transfer protein alpha isoform-like [Lucilia cuprina]
MQIIEYRITLPLTVDEYQVAQLFTLNESLKTETNNKKAIVLRNEYFSNYPLLNSGKFSSGQYTSKIYQWSARIPQFLKTILGQEALEVHEEAWDAYPYCRTIITNSVYMKDRFYIKIESLHLANDRGDQDNVHELPEELLKQRKVIHIDIAYDTVSAKDYQANEDPTKFQSLKTGRGPLVGSLWRQTCQPVMTCYKLVTCEFKSFGIQNTLETLLQRFERRIFTNFHRKLFCLIDRWYDLKFNDMTVNEEKCEQEEHNKSDNKDLKEVIDTKGTLRY